MIHGKRRPGPEPKRKVSAAIFYEVSNAIGTARKAGKLELQVLSGRVCEKHGYCQEDPYIFRGRSWLDRALNSELDKSRNFAGYMTHEHARCIIWRATKLGALSDSQSARLRLMIGLDEPPPIPPTLAIFPGASEAVAQQILSIARDALPAIGRDGKKARDLLEALKSHFKWHEVDDGKLWARYYEVIPTSGDLAAKIANGLLTRHGEN